MEQSKVIVAINECDFGSTGGVAKEVLSYFASKGFDAYLAANRLRGKESNRIWIKNRGLLGFINRLLCRLDGSDGFHNYLATRGLIKKLKLLHPTVIHLHNAHGRYLHLPSLFRYCQEQSIPIIWTLHDCWAFTGRCAHFEFVGCTRWQSSCGHCPSRNEYPGAYLFDGSSKQLRRKAELLKQAKDWVTLVCPSDWLYRYVGASLIRDVPRIHIPNGINMGSPIEPSMMQEERKSLGIPEDAKVFLFASFGYNERKGVDFVNRLASELGPEHYRFLVAGFDAKSSSHLGKNIINLGMVNGRAKMDVYYSLSDAFLNPTLEDNFPTVNLEALANGTPVITFATGGSPESLDERTGIVVPKGDYERLKAAVENFDSTRFDPKACIERAKCFSVEKMGQMYFSVYRSMTEAKKDGDYGENG